MPTPRTAVETRLEHQEAWLPPQVQVAHRVHGVLVLVGCRFFASAGVALADVGQRELHLDAVTVADAFVPEKLHAVGQVERYLHVD